MEEIPETLTQQEISDFFSARAPGIECPVCKKSDFSVLGKNGITKNVSLIGDEDSVFNHLAVMRCKHCGWIALFDKAFIESVVHGR